MKAFQCQGFFDGEKWQGSQFIQIDNLGKILSLSSDPPKDVPIEKIDGWLIPGFQNAHSHSFQYAMAGMGENLTVGRTEDDFWSWRQSMYGLATSLTPEDIEDVAAALYSEMVQMGYTWVAEFHYLHHALDGSPYANPHEISERLCRAAHKTGIGLTLIPAYYRTGGFGKEAEEKQRRFLFNSVEDYFNFINGIEKITSRFQRCHWGVGVHSLRAAEASEVIEILQHFPKTVPKHIHIAEQTQEVDDCLSLYKQRPVEWLLNNVSVDHSFHLVHATHMVESEVSTLVKTGAHVVICPSTEGNLGDGFFPMPSYWQKGGRWSIGTDSHIGLNPLEELRWLDYGQRLKTEKRNVFCKKGGEESGDLLLRESHISGSAAMGNQENFFEVGQYLDAVALDAQHPLLKKREARHRLSTLIYSCDSRAFLGTLCGGTWHPSQNGTSTSD